ncbi:hypothetical protein ACFWYW_58620 [Nonomuraea sp. NPDC059023]|uniref:hypothetical protein n=1 Tax=unclassified Nonomuraea TaxID=2593643 RepID=UPI0036AF7A90
MAEYDGYHGIHTAVGWPTATLITWYPVTPRAAYLRVRATTCQCSQIFYEFCIGGGLYFIRRYDRTGARTTLTETEWRHRRLMEELWQRILNGEAR